MKIYINWKTEEIYTSFEEVQAAYEAIEGGYCHTFGEFFDENYANDWILNANVDDIKNMINDFRDILKDEVESWMADYIDIIEIDGVIKK